MVDSITQSFDTWTSAQGIKSKGRVKSVDNISLEGINRLRELILELAIKGKLIPQEVADEPASILLRQIALEKNKLVKAGLIKKQKHLPDISSEQLIDLPSGWELCNLGNLTKQITDGTHHTPKYQDDGIMFLSVKDISSGRISFKDTKYISAEEHEELTKRCKPERNDILFCRIGTLGVPVVVDTDETFSVFVSIGLLKFFPNYILPEYLKRVLESPFLWEQYMEVKAGGSHTNKLNLKDIPTLKIPIAPFNEQKRIVAKVDELMALCDKLEDEQTNNLKTHQVLVKTILETLTQAKDATELQEAWERMSANFDTLFCTEDSIEQLKQTILQLAVMGKLVKQDPNDEPARELLRKIAVEKTRLIKDGKIKRLRPLSEIADEEKPFDLPRSWEWIRLGTGLKKITDGTHHSPPNGPKGKYLYISAKNIKPEGVLLSNATFVTQAVHDEIYSRCDPEYGDILYIKDGATTGVVTINNVKEPFSMLSSVALLKSPKEILNTYLLFSLTSPYFYQEMRTEMTGVAITRVTLKKINLALLPLPPLAEQKRIVGKVEQLFTLCDTLKESIIKSEHTKVLLSNSIVGKVE